MQLLCHHSALAHFCAAVEVIFTRESGGPGSLTSDFGLKKGDFTGRLTELLEAERLVRTHAGICHIYDISINFLMKSLWNEGRFPFCMICLKEMVHPWIFLRMVRFEARMLRERVERAFQRNNGTLHERRTA